jgi:hypothetical protein
LAVRGIALSVSGQAGDPAPSHRAADLQCDERVAAGLGMYPARGRLGERHAQPCPEQVVERAEAQAAERQYLGAHPGAVELKRQVGAWCLGALRAQQANRFVLQPAKRETRGRRRGRVQPLDVVGHHNDRR